MTEVIKVGKDLRRGEAVAGKLLQTGSETPEETEVIKFGKGPAASEAGGVEPGQPDSEKPHTTEVIKVGKGPAAAEAIAVSPIDLPHDVATVAAVFAESLKALDTIAAEQASSLVGLAIRLAEAARSPGLAESGPEPAAGDNSLEVQIDTLVTGLKQAADTQITAFAAAQARLAELAAGREPDSHLKPASASPPHPYTPVSAALANMVSNLDLAQQNAVANQQAMNSIARAAIAGGLSLLYNLTAKSAGSQEGIKSGHL